MSIAEIRVNLPIETTLFLHPGTPSFRLGFHPVYTRGSDRFQFTLFPFSGRADSVDEVPDLGPIECADEDCGVFSDYGSVDVKRSIAHVGRGCLVQLTLEFFSTDWVDLGSQLGVNISSGLRISGACNLTVVTCADHEWARSWAKLGDRFSHDGSGRLVRR